MKTLILVRHAKAEPQGIGAKDFDRRLTETGKTDAATLGNILKSQGFRPQLIVASNAPRAMQTAQIIAGQTDYDANEIAIEPFIYRGDIADELAYFVANTADEVGTLMIVDHNPDIAMFAARLADRDINAFPTATAIATNIYIDS